MASPIEIIFQDIFGYLPKKSGTAYEMLASIALSLLEGGEVIHDERLRGTFSKTLYQLDVYCQSGNSSVMGEAKDYTEDGKKVGRGDIQKLGGALPDLKCIDKGVFFSATGYTKPARKYADAASNITGGKSIALYELKASTELDEEGTIKTIVLTIHFAIPHPSRGNWMPHFTKDGEEKLRVLLPTGEERLEVQMGLSDFYDSSGNVTLTLQELTTMGYGEVNTETNLGSGCYILKNSYLPVKGILAEMQGLEYEIPFTHQFKELRITDDSEGRLVLKDSEGNVLKILTDKMLRDFCFDESGKVLKR